MPEWDNWYAGDTHWHSDITNSDYVVHREYGMPLTIAQVVSASLGLDWITITDHSFDMDDPKAVTTHRNLADYRSAASFYGWNQSGYPNLESHPGFSSWADGFGFIKGEEISVDSQNPGYQISSHQRGITESCGWKCDEGGVSLRF